ncbi:MAG: ATPase, partial [Dehalococcoidia bacterium]|nr:ATPase [Dehalococcoidia bacterium]
RKYIERDAALERRLQPVLVEEPSIEDSVEILKGVKYRYEEHHRLTITEEAAKAAVVLSARYISDRFLPDKAIDLIDEAASRVRLRRASTPPTLKEAMRGLESVRREKEAAIGSQQYEYAAELRDREMQLIAKIESMEQGWSQQGDVVEESREVTEEDIAQVVSMWTGIPVARLAGEESARLLQMEESMHNRIIGQEEAVTTIAKAIRRSRAGLKDPKRPIGVFIFLGPTGVGKSLLAKVLAEFMFGNEEALLKLDMSEFMERHNVSRLVGAPPGYVGYEDGGQLTDTVRRKSYCAILLDEIEKAHPEVFNMLLQIFEDGYLTDAKGRKVDFRNTVIMMTSNLGAELIKRDTTLGFALKRDEVKTREEAYGKMKEKVMAELQKAFKPEFLNRIDGTVVFHALTPEHIHGIVDLELKMVEKQLAEKGMTLEITTAAKDWLATKGYSEAFGARPLRRLIQDTVEDKLSEAILGGNYSSGDAVLIDCEEGEIVLKSAALAAAPA